MRLNRCELFLAWLVTLLASAAPAAPTNIVATVSIDWHDAKRNRDVPVKIYYPTTGPGPFPVIVFSHGLGGSRDGYEYLGRCWATNGFVVVHPQHLGSDQKVWTDAPPAERLQAMTRAALDVRNAVDRAADVSFVLDKIGQWNRVDDTWRGKFDTNRIGVAGHSFGGWTAMAIAGQSFGRNISFADPRVKACVEMSAPVPVLRNTLDQAFNSIHLPVFHMTGTRDDSPIGDTKAADRRLIYDHMSRAETCLAIFTDADHLVFAGPPLGSSPNNDKIRKEVCLSTTAFWNAYLKDDRAAKTWLLEGGFEKELGPGGTFERKTPPPPP